MFQTTPTGSFPVAVRSTPPIVRALTLLSLTIAAVLGACSPYQLSGRVIEGDASYAILVSPDDPRLQLPGISGVSLKLTMDPGKLNRDVVNQSGSGPDGAFDLPVDRVGAGLLNLEMSILARKAGYASAEAFFVLPGSGASHLLVVLAPGVDPPSSNEQEWSADDDMRRFWSE